MYEKYAFRLSAMAMASLSLISPFCVYGAIGPSDYAYSETKYQGWRNEICSIEEMSINKGREGYDFFLWTIELDNGGVSATVVTIDDAEQECLERCTQAGDCQAVSGTMLNWGFGPFECRLYYTNGNEIYHKPDPFPGPESYSYEFCFFKGITYYSDYKSDDPDYHNLPKRLS